jgi:GLPGLI family protein
MNKLFLFLFIAVFALSASAQQFSGTATYNSSTKMEMKMDSTRFTPEQIKQFTDMMRKQLFKEYTLKFNRSESLFEEVEELESAPQGGRGLNFAMFAGGAGGLVYKNLASKVMNEQVEFFGKIFLISDSLSLEDWKLGKETKQIGSYTCYKATTTRQIITRTVSTEKESVQDTIKIEVVAWYTPQIPLSHGPDIYWGLPGLIMEVNTDNTTILCTKIELKQEDMKVEQPTKGEKVGREEYNEIIQAKMLEMEKMRGSRQGPGGGGGHGRGSMEIRISR